MLELENFDESKVEDYPCQVNLFSESAAARAQKHEITIANKSFGEVIFKAEICTALADYFKLNDLQEACIASLRKALT